MAWRKWLVRTLVCSIVGVAILIALLYEAWTNPAAVRREVHAKLCELFVGASVSLDSARLRLLGGIIVNDLRMNRRDDLDRGDFLYAPSAVIYHDKEHLLDGKLRIQKVELDRPRLRIVRERDGRFNLRELLAPPNLNEFVPTVIVRQGTILIEDRSVAVRGSVVELTNVNVTVINDPISTLVVEGTGQADGIGVVHIHARIHRPTEAASALIELPDVPVGPALVKRIAGFQPECSAHLRHLRGSGKVEASFAYRPGAVEPWISDINCRLSKGEWNHDYLPEPLHHIEATLRCINGRVPEAHLTARSGSAMLEVTLQDLVWPGRTPNCIEDIVRKIDARVEHLVVTEQLFEHLPKHCQDLQRLYSPRGPVTLKYAYRRTGTDRWHKHLDIQPEGMSAEFEHFRYPLDGLTGSIALDLRSDHDDCIKVDLLGRGSGRPVRVKGSLRGDKANEVDLVVSANDVPIDHKLMLAVPEKSRELARTFLPSRSRELGLSAQPLGLIQPAGLVNLKVYIRRLRGQTEFANRYVLAFHDTSLKYDIFPYPLENVSGILDLQPDRWECQDFRGTHGGGEIQVSGCSLHIEPNGSQTVAARKGVSAQETAPPESRPPPRESVKVAIRGLSLPLDRDFEQALSPPEAPGRAALRNAWAMLALQGRLNFEAVVVNRPDQPQDIDVAVDVRGCTMQPEFFRYAMSDVSARVRYAQGRVYVKEVSAKHGACRLGMDDATIELKPAGGFRAWFKGIRGRDLLPDEAFLQALHPAMRKALEPLRIRNTLNVEMPKLVLDAPAASGRPMKIWWNGGVQLRKQAFEAGLEISGVDGEIWCEGHHNGQQFEGVSGYAVLDRADILGQPFTNLQGRIAIAAASPEVLRLYDLKANLFGGFLGGEAHFDFGSTLHYEVKIDALRVQLEQFGKHNKLGADAQLKGPAQASLYLKGDGSDPSGLRGDGRIEVANGKLYRLPLLLDLLKAFGLRLPDHTAFEQARMIFAIEGPKMRVLTLDLIGSAISLRGLGTVNLNGSNLNLDFNADWGRMPQMLPPGISDLSQAISDQLFKIKVRGKIGSPRFEKEFIPGVVEPVKKVFRGGS